MFCILSLKQEGVGIFRKVNEQTILNLQVLFIPKGIKVILLKKQKHNKQGKNPLPYVIAAVSSYLNTWGQKMKNKLCLRIQALISF